MIRLPSRLLRVFGLGLPVAAAMMAALTPFPQQAQRATAEPLPVDKSVAEAQKKRIAAIKKVHPAVVAVCMPNGEGCGSGVIIDADGYALTNFHVVQATGPMPTAGLADGVLYEAVVCGIDKVGDVALIKILPKEKGKPFPFVELGDSDKVKAGDWSLAMGNPFSLAMDFTPTVTYGLISGVNRYQPPEGKGLLEYTDCIQIETSINPGNSGGPLFNMDGQLIGINGRGSFEKRGRVNSGVGYAISINQIKNFLGLLRAGVDTDHATLGAALGAANEDEALSKIVVKQILEESDAFRRGLKEGDQLISFAGRPVQNTNAYKNVLGIYPKEWRIPMTARGGGKDSEMLVRLMANQDKVVEKPNQPQPGQPPQPQPQQPPQPKVSGERAKMYEARKGYSNWYFNKLERDKLLDAFKKHGDFSELKGKWSFTGEYKMADRNGNMAAEFTPDKDGTKVKLKLNIETEIQPLAQSDLASRKEPLGSGGLMIALYHYQRFLAMGTKGFEGICAHGGDEPFYPYPADGSTPKSLADLRVDCSVIVTKHDSVNCKWYLSKKDNTLLGFESYLAKDNPEDPKDRDPCEIYFYDYKAVDGRQLPHKMQVRFRDALYATLTITNYKFEK